MRSDHTYMVYIQPQRGKPRKTDLVVKTAHDTLVHEGATYFYAYQDDVDDYIVYTAIKPTGESK